VAVLLCRGGSFAGGIYTKDACLAHKTIHRYTTRRKQGGSQAARDSQGNKPKSAGSTLRRYNTARLVEVAARSLYLRVVSAAGRVGHPRGSHRLGASAQGVQSRVPTGTGQQPPVRLQRSAASGLSPHSDTAPRSYILFEGGPLHRDDMRVRNVPFPLHRVTLSEAQRAYKEVLVAEVEAKAVEQSVAVVSCVRVALAPPALTRSPRSRRRLSTCPRLRRR
jgi:hypothetical protein